MEDQQVEISKMSEPAGKRKRWTCPPIALTLLTLNQAGGGLPYLRDLIMTSFLIAQKCNATKVVEVCVSLMMTIMIQFSSPNRKFVSEVERRFASSTGLIMPSYTNRKFPLGGNAMKVSHAAPKYNRKSRHAFGDCTADS
ncbi:hypothetical protein, variant [Verruconis gallopava]|uniref:Uncharacterized protein n=1 Tax=Verruconis gallopava TaxID=253628 RepID=A0A0D1YEH5_9PEZI|nr:hypothetical protein, variant [Verruconis gallopava]KIV99116.1 hypothetical protein, variant [Verruconis gallopava]